MYTTTVLPRRTAVSICHAPAYPLISTPSDTAIDIEGNDCGKAQQSGFTFTDGQAVNLWFQIDDISSFNILLARGTKATDRHFELFMEWDILTVDPGRNMPVLPGKDQVMPTGCAVQGGIQSDIADLRGVELQIAGRCVEFKVPVRLGSFGKQDIESVGGSAVVPHSDRASLC